MPPNAFPDEFTEGLGRDGEAPGDGVGRFALVAAGRAAAAGLAAGRAAPAPVPVVGREKLEVVLGRVAAPGEEPGFVPEPQPRACALVAAVFAPDLLRRL